MASPPEDGLLGSPAEAEDYRIWKESRDRATTWLPRTVLSAAGKLADAATSATPYGQMAALIPPPKPPAPAEPLQLGERMPEPEVRITPGEPPVRPTSVFAPEPITRPFVPQPITPGAPPVRPPPMSLPTGTVMDYTFQKPPTNITPRDIPWEAAETPTPPPQMGGTATPAERVARMMGETAKEEAAVSARKAADPNLLRRTMSQLQEATAEGIKPPVGRAALLGSAAEFLSGAAAGVAPFAASMALGGKAFAEMNPEGDLRYMSQQLNRGPLGPAEVGKYADYLRQNPDVLNKLYQERIISSDMYWALTPPAA